jgi:tetrapyrrole methylase family protein / MazG family protein
MEQFNNLLSIMDTLLGPNGCPWDQKQTLFSLQTYLLEEVYELIEAIDDKNYENILDELGDVLNSIIFISKLAEKDKKFSIDDVIKNLSEKLIRRHPHIFGDKKVKNVDEILENWQEIKKKEDKHQHRKSMLDGIPKALPSLVKAQKVVSKIKKSKFLLASEGKVCSEEELGEKLMNLIIMAEKEGINVEGALRRNLEKLEKKFRNFEKTNTGDFPET